MDFSILRCPKCRSQLTHDEAHAALSCPTHGPFPMLDGIPSFVTRSESDDFDDHWKKHESTRVQPAKLVVAREFLAPLTGSLEKDASLRILDAGCGDGIHVASLNELEQGGRHRFIGIDISLPAVRQAQSRGNDQWTFSHGDVLELPLADESVDVAFSFGVVAYTEDPEGAFAELCRVVKPGGEVGIWVYPRPPGFTEFVLNTVRAACRLLGPFVTRRMADCMVPLLGLLPTRSKMTLRNSSWKECREVILVNIAPARLVFPKASEIHAWFERKSLEIVAVDDANPVTIWGRIPPRDAEQASPKSAEGEQR